MKNTHLSVDEIESWLEAKGIDRYTVGLVTENGRINVSGDVILAPGEDESIPVTFGTVTGNFICSGNQLTTLKGAPDVVGGNFICCDNQLTSLHGAPAHVIGDFTCCNNRLISLLGLSEEIYGNFICVNNPLLTRPSKEELKTECNVRVEGKVVYHIIPEDGACDVFHKSKAAKRTLATSPYAPPVFCQKVGFFGDENFDCTTCDAHSHCTQPEKNIKPHHK